MTDKESERKLTLRVLLQTNETHMTHVESEEFNFISLYLVAVSFIVSAILAAYFNGNVDKNNFWVVIIALSFLVILGIIVYWQIKRWDQVFKRRKDVFNNILMKLIIDEADEEESNKLKTLLEEKSELEKKIEDGDTAAIEDLENNKRSIDSILRNYTGANNMYVCEEKARKKDDSIRYSDKGFFKAKKEKKKPYIKTFVLVRWFIAVIILLALVMIVGTILYYFGVL